MGDLSCVAGVVLSNWIISLRQDGVSVRVLFIHSLSMPLVD